MLWDEWCEGDVARLHHLYTEGHQDAAAELAHRMLRRDEAFADAHHVLGLLAYHDNRQTEVDTHLRAAIVCAPAQAELHCESCRDPAQTGSARRRRKRRTQRADAGTRRGRGTQ